jgi:4-hydroxymandelate oxidase
MTGTLTAPRTVREYQDAARARMDPVHYDYVCGAARDEVTARANEEAFAELRLLPRVLRGRDTRSLAVDLLGARVAPARC